MADAHVKRATATFIAEIPDKVSPIIEVRLQIAAVTLAEELNFTRAADRLKITQPALSKQVIELETRLGFSVFKRNQKRVELTDAGQVFISGCRDALAILEKAIRLARATHDDIQPVVTIGHSPYADPFLISTILSVHLPPVSHTQVADGEHVRP